MDSAARRASVSVITPTRAHPARVALLHDLYTDLTASASAWEWILAVDGEDAPGLPERLTRDPRVRVLRIGRHVGAAAARNLALGIARGEFITCVDDDDRLPGGSLEVRLAAVQASGLPWVAAVLADEDDGVTQVWDSPIPRGMLQPGDVWRAWACPCLPFPVGPTTLLVDAALLRRVGGWQGLPQAEDFGMTLAVTAQASGMMLDDVVYIYHKHPGQTMRRHDFDVLEPLVRHITFERGRLLAERAAERARPAVQSPATARQLVAAETRPAGHHTGDAHPADTYATADPHLPLRHAARGRHGERRVTPAA